jgi:hypothetical protein
VSFTHSAHIPGLVPASDVNWLAVWLSIRLASQVTRKTEISIATIGRSADATSAPRLSRSSEDEVGHEVGQLRLGCDPGPKAGAALRHRSDRVEAAALHHQAEVLDRPLDLLVGVLDQLGHQLAGLAPRRVVGE